MDVDTGRMKRARRVKYYTEDTATPVRSVSSLLLSLSLLLLSTSSLRGIRSPRFYRNDKRSSGIALQTNAPNVDSL